MPYDPRNPVFFVPYRAKGTQVIGRDAVLQSVRQQLTQGHRTAIGQAAAFQGLGGLPLALELSGAYLRHRQVSWQQYRDLLKENLKAALPGALLTASFTRHEADLYSTLKIDEEVFEQEPLLREIMDLLTWSGPAPMGQSLLCALLDGRKPTELTNALGLGTALRLLQKTPNGETYTIHRLVREVRRETIPLDERGNWASNICRRLGDWFQEQR